MEIRYEISANTVYGVGNLMRTHCPYALRDTGNSKIMVQSVSCQNCDHYDGFRKSEQIVFCKHGEENENV